MNANIFSIKGLSTLKRLITTFSMIGVLISITAQASYSATYYVATTGSDGNPGTLAAPFRTVQKGLNVLVPGDTCMIRSGTYNEALALNNSGTATARITVQNYPSETVTISSGNSKALRTNGSKHYYTFDGLRFTSNHVVYASGNDYNLDFGDGVWGGQTDTTVGNNGFIVKNCYIEGAIKFYGHYNTVTNCELNGKALWADGIFEGFAACHDNIYSSNTIHDFTTRGIWSMQLTNNVLIKANTIYNINDMAIDLDGAANHVNNGTVRGNTIYAFLQQGIILENAFNCIIDANIVRDPLQTGEGTGISAMNYGPSYADGEYRGTRTNNIISNNLVKNARRAGIGATESPGNYIYNNTIYNTTSPSGYFAAISLNDTSSGSGYYDNYTVVVNNIVYGYGSYGVWISEPTSGLTGLVLSNNIYYDPAKTNVFHSTQTGNKTLSNYQSSTGQETNSKFIDPQFVSISTGDFHLQSTSPALNAGLNLAPSVTTDIANNPRPTSGNYDLGAYEFITASGTIPPPKNLTVY